MTITVEHMSPVFTKWHIPFPGVLHRFIEPDTGHPHDHPFAFTSTVLMGGYVERVFQHDGSSQLIHRRPGDEFTIGATHIHRIETLLEAECLTLIQPGTWEREPGFWRWEDGQAWFRQWNGEWNKSQ